MSPGLRLRLRPPPLLTRKGLPATAGLGCGEIGWPVVWRCPVRGGVMFAAGSAGSCLGTVRVTRLRAHGALLRPAAGYPTPALGMPAPAVRHPAPAVEHSRPGPSASRDCRRTFPPRPVGHPVPVGARHAREAA